MEINVNALKPAANNTLFPTGKRTDLAKEASPHPKNVEADPLVQDQQVQDLSKPEKERLDTVIKTVQTQMFKNNFAVADSTFTIFKDSSGQFITRITSLRDGSVRYIPEPDVMQFLERASELRASLLEVQA